MSPRTVRRRAAWLGAGVILGALLGQVVAPWVAFTFGVLVGLGAGRALAGRSRPRRAPGAASPDPRAEALRRAEELHRVRLQGQRASVRERVERLRGSRRARQVAEDAAYRRGVEDVLREQATRRKG